MFIVLGKIEQGSKLNSLTEGFHTVFKVYNNGTINNWDKELLGEYLNFSNQNIQ